MSKVLYFYQHLPSFIDPDIHLGFFSISWYAIMYLAAFLIVYGLLKYRIAKGEWDNIKIQNPKSKYLNKSQVPNPKLQENFLIDLLLYSFAGLLVGARLGYVLFYNLPYYLKYPLAIVWPFDPMSGKFIGLYGMSYHGGLIGVIIVAVIFCRKNKIKFWPLGNFIAPAVPAGYFFGRLGNFINGELYGRVTTSWWGMYFPQAQNFSSWELRYPSQLIEAFLEGVVLFLILWSFRNKNLIRNNALILYLLGYAVARFISEFFRAPDPQIGYIWRYFTLGQIFSVVMFLIAAILLLQNKKVWYNTIKQK